MSRILLGLIIILVLIVGAIFIAPSLIPTSVYRSQIEKQVEAATGRDLTIEGKVNVSIFPRAQIDMTRVSLANVEGGKAEALASMEALQVDVGLIGLLSGTLEVNRFVLVRPVINLEIDRSGKANWAFATTDSKVVPVPAEGGGNSGSGTGALPLENIMLGDVGIVDGTVNFVDFRQSPEVTTVENIDVELDMAGVAQPFEVDGSLDYRGETINVTATIDSIATLIEAKPSPLTLAINSDLAKLDVKGTFTNATTPTLDGSATVDVPSLRKVAGWLGTEIPQKNGYGPLLLKGNLAMVGDKYAFKDATIRFDDIKGTGAVTVALGGKVPSVAGTLALETLDLRPYTTKDGGQSSGAGTAPAPAPAGGSTEWSNDPIDFSALKLANADLSLSADKIFVDTFEVGRSALTIKLTDGVMTTNLTDLNLYEGAGKGSLTVDARGANAAKVQSSFTMTGIQAKQLLDDLQSKELIEGKGDITFSVTTEGRSQRQFVKALDGNGKMIFRDGKIIGVDIVRVLKAVDAFRGKPEAAPASGEGQAVAGDAQGSGNETTFVEMGGTFTIADGIVTNDDFKMVNEVISVTGAGTVDLPQKKLRYRLEPGQSTDDGGLQVAVLAKGPWDNIEFHPILDELIKQEAARALEKGLGIKEDSAAGQLLRGILGSDKKAK